MTDTIALSARAAITVLADHGWSIEAAFEALTDSPRAATFDGVPYYETAAVYRLAESLPT